MYLIDYQTCTHIYNMLKIDYKKIHVTDNQLVLTLSWHSLFNCSL